MIQVLYLIFFDFSATFCKICSHPLVPKGSRREGVNYWTCDATSGPPSWTNQNAICVRGFRGGWFVKVKVTFEAEVKESSCAQIKWHFCAGHVCLIVSDRLNILD